LENSGAEDTGVTNLKRRRKPSEKVLEQQAQKIRKPLQKTKGSGRHSKARSRIGIEQEYDMYLSADEDGSDD
ncbi:hypothetical protein Tco_1444986, partial [Tanacetum coccineum]